jgi:hypothetical protein
MLRPRFTIAIAQPGLSKAGVSAAQLELLASSEVYRYETLLATFSVLASKWDGLRYKLSSPSRAAFASRDIWGQVLGTGLRFLGEVQGSSS